MPRITKYDPNNTFNIVAGEALAEGELVGIADTNGYAFKADNDATQGTGATNRAVGFVVKAAAIGKMAAVAPIATVDGFSGLTVGGPCYLSATAGGITQTKPTTNGVTLQMVGIARSATEILGNVQTPQKAQTAGTTTLTSL